MGKRLHLDGGKLWLYTAPPIGPGGLILLALRALVSGLESEDVEAHEAKECWIEARKGRLDVARDGEVSTMSSPLHYTIRPRALRVLAPSGAPAKLLATEEV